MQNSNNVPSLIVETFAKIFKFVKKNILATIRKGPNEVTLEYLKDFGQYCAECLPKFIQKVQIASGDELELLIAPEGVVPTLSFLKNHHNGQFLNISDITALDVPSRPYRFEVTIKFIYLSKNSKITLFYNWN